MFFSHDEIHRLNLCVENAQGYIKQVEKKVTHVPVFRTEREREREREERERTVQNVIQFH